jgi:hypothetical protein
MVDFVAVVPARKKIEHSGHHQGFFVGALAMENVRVLPSASVSEGSTKVMSRNWPALNVQSPGFLKRNALVHSVTSSLLTSLDRVTGEAVAMSSPSRRATSGIGTSGR